MNALPSNSIAPQFHSSICDIVQQALHLGCLTIDAENQLRILLRQKYDRVDLLAFMQLQAAAMSGSVRQESRDRVAPNPKPCS